MPERFSWVVPNKLAVGSFPKATTSAAQLRRQGITAVLCLTEVAEQAVPPEIPHNFVWERIPIPDGATGGIPTEEQFSQALKVIHRWQRKGHVIYVHCLAGVGRSASVCSLCIVQSQNVALDDAIAFVKQQHAFASPDPHQIRVMESFLASLPAN